MRLKNRAVFHVVRRADAVEVAGVRAGHEGDRIPERGEPEGRAGVRPARGRAAARGVNADRKTRGLPDDRAAGVRGLGVHAVKEPAAGQTREAAGRSLERLILCVQSEVRTHPGGVEISAHAGLAADGRVIDAAPGDPCEGSRGGHRRRHAEEAVQDVGGLQEIILADAEDLPVVAHAAIHHGGGAGDDGELILHRGGHVRAVGQRGGNVHLENTAGAQRAMPGGEHAAVRGEPASAAAGEPPHAVVVRGHAIVRPAEGALDAAAATVVVRAGRVGHMGIGEDLLHLHRDAAVAGRDDHFHAHGVAVEKGARPRPHLELRGIERLALAVRDRGKAHPAREPERGLRERHAHARRAGHRELADEARLRFIRGIRHRSR